MKEEIKLKNKIGIKELKNILKKTTFRGLYNLNGENLKPYKDVNFYLAKVYPQKSIGDSPTIHINKNVSQLFTPQPTIYQNQIEIIENADKFLKSKGFSINKLEHALELDYESSNRGTYHMLPPIIEKHEYKLKDGFIDLERLSERFKNTYVKDARGCLHHIADRYLQSFYIDEISKINHLDIFNSNASIINYGLKYNGKKTFYIICDGAHRIDYSIEKLNEPITVLVAKPKKNKVLIPYYAFPVTFRPTIRLSSKKSEKMFHKIERDKIHLFNDFIKKILHYDWGELKVSKLRSNADIH